MRIMYLMSPRNRNIRGDAESGDFVLLEPSQSLGNYIEAILVEKRGQVGSCLDPMKTPIIAYVLTIRHSLIHDNGSEEVLYHTHSKLAQGLLDNLVVGNLYRLSTELKGWKQGSRRYTFYRLVVNRQEPSYA